jgi:dTDP-4-amino-4,6-dideoxygalactose transaminase
LALKLTAALSFPFAAAGGKIGYEVEFVNRTDKTRRAFLTAVPAACVAAAPAALAVDDRPAVLGGKPVRSQPFPSWPIFDESEEKAIGSVVRSAKWGRGNGQVVNQFEQAYAKFTGARGCLTTVNGTNALYISLNTLGVEPGDEVLVPPFTFVATVNVVLRQHALPVFVDSDIESFQIDARKAEPLITDRTRAIIPVHLGGNPANMDVVMDVAKRHKLIVVEDACQAWVAQWRGRNVGRIGNCGCFSFQASKNINSGEGGAIISDDEGFIERSYGFHTQGRMRKGGEEFGYSMSGTNLRMTEFQAAILLQQLKRLEEHSKRREQNAAYLSSLLKETPGVIPAKMYEGCTRNAYHLYMFRYDKEKFGGLSRDKFLRAVRAEGVPASAGYGPLNKSAFLKKTMETRGFRRLFPAARLKRWEEQNLTPVNDRLCEEACWMLHTTLLADRSAMDQIAAAIRKVHKNAAAIARA